MPNLEVSAYRGFLKAPSRSDAVGAAGRPNIVQVCEVRPPSSCTPNRGGVDLMRMERMLKHVLAPELERGELVKAHTLSLPGLSYYLLHLLEHPRKRAITLFADWLRSVV